MRLAELTVLTFGASGGGSEGCPAAAPGSGASVGHEAAAVTFWLNTVVITAASHTAHK